MARRWGIGACGALVVTTATLTFAGCSQPQHTSSFGDGGNFGSMYWQTAKNNGLSYVQECESLEPQNAPSGDNATQWIEGCVSAGKAEVNDPNGTGNTP
jgi:hypothetical protein